MWNKKILKCFLLDHLPLLFFCLLLHIVFFGVLFYIKELWIEDFFYFSFLFFLCLCLFLCIRYYKTARVYQNFLLESETLSDYLIPDPRSNFEKKYNQMIHTLLQNNSKKEIFLQQEKKLQKALLYRFVHQMKTPLSVLTLSLENTNATPNHARIQRNLNSLQYNLNQILNVYRLDDFKKDFVSEKVKLKEICKESIHSLKDAFITAQIYPKLEMAEDIYVYSDSKWLKLMLQQLLSNAIKYSVEGQGVHITAQKQNEHTVLRIVDNGIGIEKADLKQIFELFYVGKNGRNNADSSGIGLYIVKRVAEHLGHIIEIESALQQGTSVSITF